MRRTNHLRARQRRVFLLFGGLAVLLLCLILLLGLSSPIEVLGPESPELQAMRASSDNACEALVAVASTLPPKPGGIEWGSRTRQGLQRFRPLTGSIGHALNVGQSDDNPFLLEYLEATRPVLESLHEALEMPFCLVRDDLFVEAWDPNLVQLGQVIAGHMAYAWSTGGVEAAPEIAALLLDGLKLGRWLTEAGGSDLYFVGMNIQQHLLTVAVETVPWRELPPETLARLAEGIDAAAAGIPTGRANLEYDWRRIGSRTDALIGYRPPVSDADFVVEVEEEVDFDEHRGLALGFSLFLRWRESRARRFLAKQKDRLFEVVEQDSRAALEALAADPGFASTTGRYYRRSVARLLNARLDTRERYAGFQRVLALNRYHRDHGEFPTEMIALAPRYLDASQVGPPYCRDYILHEDDVLIAIRDGRGGWISLATGQSIDTDAPADAP